jgi:ribosomal protein S18 acetylase RimI-like enzyme
MVATSLRRPRSNFRGILPFDPGRDLGAVARLLEEAFREENAMPFSKLPLVRELGIFMWTLNYIPAFPENISGFVWAEDGKIVGNLTLTRDEGWTDRYFISNVAVDRAYRRRGIARQLLRAALDELRAHRARWALLNVRPRNQGAIGLYKEFRFEEIETRGEWVLPSLKGRSVSGEIGEIKPLRWSDRNAVVELMRVVAPDRVKKLRKQEIHPYWLYWEDRLTEIITDFFIGQRTRRWKLERDGKLIALVTIQGQNIFSPHRLQFEVYPQVRGQIEDSLVTFALRELSAFPARRIHSSGTNTHPELIAALERYGFKMQNGLTLMALEF